MHSGAGSGYVTAPFQRRASRSIENRAPSDAELRLYPGYETEYVTPNRQTPVESKDKYISKRRLPAGKYTNHLARAQGRIAELTNMDTREVERAHILMLAL
jgi:hypothetical protein